MVPAVGVLAALRASIRYARRRFCSSSMLSRRRSQRHRTHRLRGGSDPRNQNHSEPPLRYFPSSLSKPASSSDFRESYLKVIKFHSPFQLRSASIGGHRHAAPCLKSLLFFWDFEAGVLLSLAFSIGITTSHPRRNLNLLSWRESLFQNKSDCSSSHRAVRNKMPTTHKPQS